MHFSTAILVFLLPAETEEKIGLGISSMLAMIVFLMTMTENLPPTNKLPLAGRWKSLKVVTSEQSERSSYYQSIICRLDDIQTVLIPLKKIGKNLNKLV